MVTEVTQMTKMNGTGAGTQKKHQATEESTRPDGWDLTVHADREKSRLRVLIVGAGFGGINAAHALGGKDVDVLILDRNNYHGFWPLLYQVATAALEPES